MSHRPEQHRAGLTGGAEAVGHSPSSHSLKDVTQHTQLPETLVRSTEKCPSQPNQKIITGSFWLHMALLRSVILCFQKKSTRARVNSNIRVRALEMVEKNYTEREQKYMQYGVKRTNKYTRGKKTTYLMSRQTWMELLMSHLYKPAGLCSPYITAQMLQVASYKHLPLHEARDLSISKTIHHSLKLILYCKTHK